MHFAGKVWVFSICSLRSIDAISAFVSLKYPLIRWYKYVDFICLPIESLIVGAYLLSDVTFTVYLFF